jgi:hypothetical protein
MGVTTRRVLLLIVIASLATSIASTQTWWRADSAPAMSGTDEQGLTTIGDGVIVLLVSAMTCLVAFLALVRPQIRRPAGAAILGAGAVMLGITTYDLIYLPSLLNPMVLGPAELRYANYYATLILYLAAGASLLIGLAGVILVGTTDERTDDDYFEKGAEAWA